MSRMICIVAALYPASERPVLRLSAWSGARLVALYNAKSIREVGCKASNLLPSPMFCGSTRGDTSALQNPAVASPCAVACHIEYSTTNNVSAAMFRCQQITP